MKSLYRHALAFLVGVAVATGAALVLRENDARNDYRARAENASVQLAYHLSAIRSLARGDAAGARRMLLNLADGNVLELMNLNGAPGSDEGAALMLQTLAGYSRVRSTIPEAHEIPGYIRDEEKDEYIENGRRIQAFLDDHARRSPPR